MPLTTHCIELKKAHKRVIKNAYDFCVKDSLHYGNGVAIFPGEQQLLNKVIGEESTFELTDNQVDLLYSWLKKYMNPGYGTQNIFMGAEADLFQFLDTLANQIDDERRKKREAHLSKQLQRSRSNGVLGRLMNKLRKNTRTHQELKDEAGRNLRNKE